MMKKTKEEMNISNIMLNCGYSRNKFLRQNQNKLHENEERIKKKP